MEKTERLFFMESVLILEATIIGLEAEVAKARATLSSMKRYLELERRESIASVDPELLAKLKKSIGVLEIDVRSYNCLTNDKVKTIGELVQKDKASLLKIKNFGHKSLYKIIEILTDMGLSLGMELSPEVLEALKEG